MSGTPIDGSDATGLVLKTYTAPIAGDFVTGASVQVVTQGLANDLANVFGSVVPFGTRIVTRYFAREPFEFAPTAADWIYGSATFTWADQQREGSWITYALDAPTHAVLVALAVTIHPAGGHGALPTTKPKIDLIGHVVSTDTVTTIGTASDSQADVTAYELQHTITLTPSVTNTAWVATTAYVIGDVRKNAGLLFLCTHAGTSGSTGPDATDQSILDGTAVWAYAGAVTALVLDRSTSRYNVRFTGEDDNVNGVLGLKVIGVRATFATIWTGYGEQ